jgi:hypothetical protein
VGGAEDTDSFTAVQQQHPTVPASYTWQPQQPQQQGSSSDTTTAVTGTSAFTTDTDVLSDVTSVPTALRAPPLTYTEAPPSCGEEYPTGMPPPPPPEVRVCVHVSARGEGGAEPPSSGLHSLWLEPNGSLLNS